MKRARTVVVNSVGTRPIDKQIIAVNKTTLAGTQTSTTLATATYPCTITGLRWDFTAVQDGGTGVATGMWAIVKVSDGNSANTISFTDAASTYQPEQDVLAFGTWAVDNNTDTQRMNGSTKTMRKLAKGDELIFIARGVATNTTAFFGATQFFCKSG